MIFGVSEKEGCSIVGVRGVKGGGVRRGWAKCGKEQGVLVVWRFNHVCSRIGVFFFWGYSLGCSSFSY